MAQRGSRLFTVFSIMLCPPHTWSLFIAFLTLGFPGGSEAKNRLQLWDWGSTSGQEDCLGREWQPTQDSCLRNFMAEEPGELQSMWGCKESNMTGVTHTFLPLIYLLIFSPIKNIQPPLNSKIYMGIVKSKFGSLLHNKEFVWFLSYAPGKELLNLWSLPVIEVSL